MIKANLEKRTSYNSLVNKNNLEVSIQFSLGGFSFCIVNSKNEIVTLTSYQFQQACATPQDLLSKIKEVFEKDSNLHLNFDSISVVHQNNLNTLVPNEYFMEQNLKNYLNYTVKTFASDFITFDDVNSIMAKNIYIPFVNINNYLLDNFGDFNFYHHQTILIDKLLSNLQSKDKEVFVYISNNLMDVVVLENKKLLLANSFEFDTKEDFIYYILFVYEQLQLNTTETKLHFIGSINKESELYNLAFSYIKNIEFFNYSNSFFNNTNDFENTEEYLITPTEL